MRGQAEFRVERQGIVMAGLGKLSFTDAQLKENLRSFMIALSNAKPEQVKGQYFRVRSPRMDTTPVVCVCVWSSSFLSHSLVSSRLLLTLPFCKTVSLPSSY